MSKLSQEKLYLFDTQGFVVMEDVLSSSQIRMAKRELKSMRSSAKFYLNTERFDNLVNSSQNFKKFAEKPEILARITQLINQPIRLIESYALNRLKDGFLYLHNGYSQELVYEQDIKASLNMSINHTYHNGRLYCMFLKAIFYLDDIQTVEDGPFCYIQGSHKANFPFPWPKDNIGKHIPIAISGFPSLSTVPVKAGDVLIINEALLHGALPKKSNCERWMMAFSYAPSFVSDWKPLNRANNDIYTAGHYDADGEEDFFV